MSEPLLIVENLHAHYGESHVLHGANLTVELGELVTLLGRNGSGRTSTLRAILGMTGSRAGSVRIDGVETINMATYKIARLGIGYCPEERGVFSSLSAEENLMLPPVLSKGTTQMSVDEIYALFPNLAERRQTLGSRLSGGEQQMLAIARVLRSGARLLLLDEISEGLAPRIVEEISKAIHVLKTRGYTILLVEQNFEFAAPLADRFYIMEHGRIVEHFAQNQLGPKTDMLHQLLGV
jgi:branched-chain amino acid transport system ATP-binding protein